MGIQIVGAADEPEAAVYQADFVMQDGDAGIFYGAGDGGGVVVVVVAERGIYA